MTSLFRYAILKMKKGPAPGVPHERRACHETAKQQAVDRPKHPCCSRPDCAERRLDFGVSLFHPLQYEHLSLYTDKAKGILTEQRFMKLTAALEQEQESNQKRLHDLAMMQSRADAQESEVRTFIKEIRRYAAIEELDEAVLNRLIGKILIGEVKKVDGQKVQEVRIVYNFVGEIPEIAA